VTETLGLPPSSPELKKKGGLEFVYGKEKCKNKKTFQKYFVAMSPT
jgi:hypothetical protein